MKVGISLKIFWIWEDFQQKKTIGKHLQRESKYERKMDMIL